VVCDAAVTSSSVTNGHKATGTVVAITINKHDEQKLEADRAACLELMRRQMEEEREKRRAIIAEVGLI